MAAVLPLNLVFKLQLEIVGALHPKQSYYRPVSKRFLRLGW